MSVLTPDVSDARDLCLAADWPGDTVLHCVTAAWPHMLSAQADLVCLVIIVGVTLTFTQ